MLDLSQVRVISNGSHIKTSRRVKWGRCTSHKLASLKLVRNVWCSVSELFF